MSDIAPILFVTPARNNEGNDPNLLICAPFQATPEQILHLCQPGVRAAAEKHGVTVIVTGKNKAAVRIGSPEHGIVGHTTIEHALAFAADVLTNLARFSRQP